jgi:hypothetical protein
MWHKAAREASQKKYQEDSEFRRMFLEHLLEASIKGRIKGRQAFIQKYQEDPEFRKVVLQRAIKAARVRNHRTLGAESEICPYPHDTPKPAFVYVLPFILSAKSTQRIGPRQKTEMRNLFRSMPHGIFCYECYQRHRAIIETATELLELWHLTRKVANYGKECQK